MSRLIFIALNVSDIDKSIAFYRNGFGIDFHTDENKPLNDTWYGGYHGEFSWGDGAYLHFALFPALPPERPVSRDVQIGFRVASIEAAHDKALEWDVAVVHPPRQEPWGPTARYRDPDGNLISITEN